MHRFPRLAGPTRRALSALSHAARHPPVDPPFPTAISAAEPPGAPIELFEDDIVNHLYAPTLPATPSRPSKLRSRAQDAVLYGPAENAAYERQLALEQETVDLAIARFHKASEDASARGDVATFRPATDLLVAWYNPFVLAVRAALENPSGNSTKGKHSSGRKRVEHEVRDQLEKLPPEALAVITLHTMLSLLMRESSGVPLPRVALSVADAVRAEINMKRISQLQREHDDARVRETLDDVATDAKAKHDGNSVRPNDVLQHALRSSSTLVSAVNFAAAKMEARHAVWSQREQLLLGTKLIDMFLSVAKVQDMNGEFVPAIVHTLKFRKDDMVKVGMLQLSEAMVNTVKEDCSGLVEHVSPKQQPMVIRPRPWTSPTEGAYLRCPSQLVRRTPGSYRDAEKMLEAADLSTLFEGLNALGDQPWCVNRHVLETSQALWDSGGGIAGLVTKRNCEVPNRKEFLATELAAFEKRKARQELWGPRDVDESTDDAEEEFDEKKVLRKLRMERRKAQKLNRELVSMRADTEHRMKQAARFVDEERIWLPHNVDFRGRAYPIPVHLQHMGCDLTRALLTFSKPGVMLGDRGVYWLKIHLANLLGGDKLSFSERIALAEDNIGRAIQVGLNPQSESNLEWWSTAEDPFQLLAACAEIAEACGRHGGEEGMKWFESSLPISMDGSCNGLQHYAALGRDVEGGTQVNLVPNDRPQDVYSGIAALVQDKVEAMAAEGDEYGVLLKGKVSRKVVKQTVMTSVYGVTQVGARQQIMNRLSEIGGFPEDKLFTSSVRLARLTLSSLGDIFQGATETMEWLYDSANRVSRNGNKVSWTTPVGLPVMQPYRRSERKVVRTLLQRVTLDRGGEHTPVSAARQRSAFPPNFVHSIDSAHMLVTGMACRRAGLNFAAVHDSFWTNAAHVDVMNQVLREEFIRLHSRDLLGELRDSFRLQYNDVEFLELPKRGKLDLSVVRDSPYFFS